MFNSTEVAERIKIRSKEINVQLKDVFERSGLNKNMMAGMRNGSMPKADNLAKIAEQLDCSVDYLLGLDGQAEKPAPTDGDGPDERKRMVYDRLARLTPENLEIAIGQLDVLLNLQEKRDKR